MADDSPYQKYVFDIPRRKFVGQFEKMYANEDAEKYDSWYQDTLTILQKQVSLTILARYNFGRVLDFGCGKGAFTHLLKKENNDVLGIDLSSTAVKRARTRFPDIRFRTLPASSLRSLGERFDVVVAMEVLSYIKEWERALADFAAITDRLYLTLSVPPNPIGHVPSLDALRASLLRHFRFEHELLIDGRILCAMLRSSRSRGKRPRE